MPDASAHSAPNSTRARPVSGILTESPLPLASSTPFSHGKYRYVFEHPHDPRWCVKVTRPDTDPRRLRRQARWWKRLRSVSSFDQTQREFRLYRQYQRHYPDQVWHHVPRCAGLVTTDLGPGLVVELIRGDDGEPAPRLSDSLQRGDEIDAALDRFRAFLRRHRLLTHELRLQNLVVGPREDDGVPRIYIVDAIGLSSWVPLPLYVPRLAAASVERKIERMNDRVQRARRGEHVR